MWRKQSTKEKKKRKETTRFVKHENSSSSNEGTRGRGSRKLEEDHPCSRFWCHRGEEKARISRYVALWAEETGERRGERDGCGAYRRSQKHGERTMSRDNCRENCVMPLFTLGKLTIYDSAITPLIGSSTVFFDRSSDSSAFVLVPVIRSRAANACLETFFFLSCDSSLVPRKGNFPFLRSHYEQLYISIQRINIFIYLLQTLDKDKSRN